MVEEKNFACSVCGKEFSKEESMQQHRKDTHQVAQQVPVKKPFRIKKILPYLIGILILVGIGYGIYFALTASSSSIGPLYSAHIHADFAIFLNGQQITPLSSSYFVRSPYVHLESGAGAGTIIHMHAANVPLDFFFKSLGMDFTSACFKLDNSSQYCSSEDKTLKIFVKHANGDWQQNFEYGKYVFKDLDKILITYGNETVEQIQLQQNSVSDFAKDNS